MKTFTIHYELTVDLSERELYPDGTDGIEEITPEKVTELIQSSGGMKTILREWDLYPYGELTVTEK